MTTRPPKPQTLIDPEAEREADLELNAWMLSAEMHAAYLAEQSAMRTMARLWTDMTPTTPQAGPGATSRRPGSR